MDNVIIDYVNFRESPRTPNQVVNRLFMNKLQCCDSKNYPKTKHHCHQKSCKNSKFIYYAKNLLSYGIPNFFYRKKLTQELAMLSEFEAQEIMARVDYYNKLTSGYSRTASLAKVGNETNNLTSAQGGNAFVALKDFTLNKDFKPHTYFFDTYRYTRYFDPKAYLSFLYGDVVTVPKFPHIVKSRPISQNNGNSVLLNLNRVRHFVFVADQTDYLAKKDLLVWRGGVYQPHRRKFFIKLVRHPLCNLGHVGRDIGHPDWVKPPMTILEQLQYKFVLCLEGNDVATNLKWVMSSNSIAVMPKPKFETWFMEGTLIPDYHYIEIKDDYSDLVKKLTYYLHHPEEALAINAHAHEYVAKFKDPKKEDLCALLVLKKYFELQEP